MVITGLISVLFTIFLIVVLLLRLPDVQQFITDKVTQTLSDQWNSKLSIRSLYLTFRGDLLMQELYLEDQQEDTLLYVGELQTGLDIGAFLLENKLQIGKTSIQNSSVNIYSLPGALVPNYQFILDNYQTDEQPTDTAQSESNLAISFGPVLLANHQINYQDSFTGIDLSASIDELNVFPADIKLNDLIFDLQEVVLNGVSGSMVLHDAPQLAEEEPSTLDVLPIILIQNISISDIQFAFNSLVDELAFDTNLKSLGVTNLDVHLSDQKVNINTINLSDSRFALNDKSPWQEPTEEPDTSSQSEFTWPEWEIKSNRISIEKHRFTYQVENAPKISAGFDPNHIDLEVGQLFTDSLLFMPENVGLHNLKLSVSTRPGLEVDTFEGDFILSPRSAKIDRLNLNTGKSLLQGYLHADFRGFNQWLSNPLDAQYRVNLDTVAVDLAEAQQLFPDLDTIPYFNALNKGQITATLKANASANQLILDNINLAYGQQMRLTGSGQINNYDEPRTMYGNLNTLKINTSKAFIARFIEDTAYLPPTLQLTANASFDSVQMSGVAQLYSPFGSINSEVSIQNIWDDFRYEANIDLIQWQFGQIIPNAGLDTLDAKVSINGDGLDFLKGPVNLSTSFQTFQLNGYAYEPFTAQINIADSIISLATNLQDPNIEARFEGKLKLASDNAMDVDFQSTIKAADLKKLKFTEEDIKVRHTISGQYSSDSRQQSIDLALRDNLVIRGSDVYRLDDIVLEGLIAEQAMDFTIRSGFANGYLKANSDPSRMLDGFEQVYRQLIPSDTTEMLVTLDEQLDIEFDMTINRSPLLGAALLAGLTAMDTIKISGLWQKGTVDFTASAPQITYSDTSIDSLSFNFFLQSDSLLTKLQFKKVNAGPVNIARTTWQMSRKNRHLEGLLTVEEADRQYNLTLGYTLDQVNDTLIFSLLPDQLILNHQPWQVSANNAIRLAEDYLHFNQLQLNRNQKQVSVSNKNDRFNNAQVSFSQFELADLFAVFNVENTPVDGIVNGYVMLDDIFSYDNLSADLSIDSLTILNNLLGRFAINANRLPSNRFEISSDLKGPQIDLSLTGAINANQDVNDLNLALTLNEFDVALLENFTFGSIKDASGTVKGNFQINGNTANPKYQGDIRFEEASFVIAQLNVPLTLSNEAIKITQDAVLFNQFTILDEDQSSSIIDGRITTTNLLNPAFDLTITSDEFDILNAPSTDSTLYHGNISLTLDMDIRGDLLLPRIDLKSKLNKGSHFTYILPESELELIEREGIVMFVNAKDSLNPILQPTRQSGKETIRGISLKSNITVDPGTSFTLVLDQQSGDYVKMGGSADLAFNITPAGQMSLNGQYIFEQGVYDMSFYEVVQRKFEVVPGSNITWTGDPYQADLDLQALYRLKTSAAELMADQITGANSTTRVSYGLAVPIDVKLFIEGALNDPAISFALDMPQDERGAGGGNIYTKLMQINENESQLNKQVFSLIVFNQFLPGDVAAAEYSGRTYVARSSVNQILSSQLNNLSNKYIKGIDLDFNLNSYTDYQQGSGVERTDLNLSIKKALFDERVILKVGSNVNVEGQSQNVNEIFEDFSIEYLLNEEGQYRLKGFRKNTFLDLVEGQIVITGLSLLFSRDFNEFNELFAKPQKQDQP